MSAPVSHMNFASETEVISENLPFDADDQSHELWIKFPGKMAGRVGYL